MGQKLTQRATNPNPLTPQDVIHAVSVADTSQSPQGSSYKMTAQQLAGFMKKAGMGNWTTVAPTVNDDSTLGYVNGAFWFDEDAQRFYILNDNSAGAADWRPFDLQMAYDGGNIVNGADVIIDGGGGKLGIGGGALSSSSATNVNAFGDKAGQNSSGNNINALGNLSANASTGNDVNAFGSNAANGNQSNDSNFFGRNAGVNNATPFGVTVFSPESIPSYADQAAADAALTVANGCVAGQIYLWRLTGANNIISFVIPT